MIHIFEPLRTHPSPSRFADVRIWFGSLPKSASVRPKHPIASPVAIFGSHCCFCSSVPNLQIGNMQSDPWTLTNERKTESPASSSRHASP